ncbi:MAG: spore cortex biosynthesis protein YabQ [Lachnospirales bacterium]
MILSMNEQFYLFFSSIAIGIIGGFVYGIIRIFRIYISHSLLGIYIEDILFWLIFAVVFFLTMLCLNYGELRPYIYFGLLIGGFLYRLFIHKLVIKFLNPFVYLLRLFAEIILTPFMVVLYPFKKLAIFIKKHLQKYKKYERIKTVCKHKVFKKR